MSETPRDASHARLRVLLLEDSQFDAELLRESLRASYPGATLDLVSTEQGFREALQAGGWDLILSDYELPGFSGAHALHLRGQISPLTPFIFVSGVIGEDNAVEMLKRGATDYVSKGRLSRLPVVIERALREVSERRARGQAQSRLREANDLYARVVDSLRDYAVILLDTGGVIRAWNRAATDIFGLRHEDVVGASVARLFTPEDLAAGQPHEELRQALQAGKADQDRWMMRSDGLRLWAEGVVSPLFSEDGLHTGYCKIVHDATVAYRDAEALRLAKEEAERANHAKDRFLAVLSHELRTPLAPIATAAHLLERVVAVPDKYATLLPMIQRNIALESRLIDDLLDLTALSAGKVHLKFCLVDMHRLARNVVDMLDAQLREKQLTLALELNAPQHELQADEARMQQVVWNLMRNAIKFTPAHGRVTLRTETRDGDFLLHCCDTGIGIDPAALPRIFGAFEQADHEGASRFGGLGLGLAIARGLVAEHRGELSAASEGLGRGATFTLRLSLDAAAPRPQPTQSVSDETVRLLLVEDNRDAAETIILCLEGYGYQITHADTYASALEVARQEAFDVVLTDLGLPDGSGIDVGRALSPRVPVVALSGYGATPDLQLSAKAGFSAHLVKPAHPHAVHLALRKALAAARGQPFDDAAHAHAPGAAEGLQFGPA